MWQQSNGRWVNGSDVAGECLFSWLAGRDWQIVVAYSMPTHDRKQATSVAEIKYLTMTMIT